MEAFIRQGYRAMRGHAAPDAPLTVLHIGGDQTEVAIGRGAEAEEVLQLALGYGSIVARCFRHWPPTPAELELAIMVVEDEVMRARKLVMDYPILLSCDALVRQIAQRAGEPAGAGWAVSLDAVERQFDLLAAFCLGRPLASAGIPDDPEFAAALLILREFMHHLKFEALLSA